MLFRSSPSCWRRQGCSFPLLFTLLVPGENPDPFQIGRQRRYWRRHHLGGAVFGELVVEVPFWLSGGGWWCGRSSSAVVSVWQGFAYLLPWLFLLICGWRELGAHLCGLGAPRSSGAASSFHCCLAFSRPAVPLLLRVCRSSTGQSFSLICLTWYGVGTLFWLPWATAPVPTLVLGGASPSLDGSAPFVPGRGGWCPLRRWRRLVPCRPESLEQTRVPLHLLSSSCRQGPADAYVWWSAHAGGLHRLQAD